MRDVLLKCGFTQITNDIFEIQVEEPQVVIINGFRQQPTSKFRITFINGSFEVLHDGSRKPYDSFYIQYIKNSKKLQEMQYMFESGDLNYFISIIRSILK